MAQKLINLRQIAGGQALFEAVEKIKASYPAEQVTTDINKKVADGEEPATYTAQELLTELKSSLDSLNGDGGTGSISDQIKDAKEELQGFIDEINNKVIYDTVRVFIPEYSALTDIPLTGLTQTEYTNINTTGEKIIPITDGKYVGLPQEEMKKFQLNTPYIVYDFYNQVILDEFKKNVTVTFTEVDGAEIDPETTLPIKVIKANLSAIPCFFTEEKTSEVVADESVALASDLRTLPLLNTYLDDTADITVIDAEGEVVSPELYYVKALAGKIYFKQEQKTQTYTVSYTCFKYTEKVEKQETFAETTIDKTDGTGETDALLWKIFPVKELKFSEMTDDYLLDNNELNQVTLQNTINQLSDKLATESDIVEQIIAKVGEESIQNALTTITNELAKRLTAVEKKVEGLYAEAVDDFELTELQDKFLLSKVPTEKLVRCFINGVRYFENKEFTIDRLTKEIADATKFKPSMQWTFDSANGGFDLDENFEVVLEYLADMDKELLVKTLKELTDTAYKMADIYPTDYTTMTTLPEDFEISKLTTMESMFAGCANLVIE